MLRRTALLATLPLAVLTACGSPAADVAGSPAGDAMSTRSVTDARGEVEVPAEPERVVVLDGYAVDALGAVGSTPTPSASGRRWRRCSPGSTSVRPSWPGASRKRSAAR